METDRETQYPGEHAREEAEGELAPRFARPLRVMAARRLGDPAEGEDVAQETLSRVVVALREGRLRDPAALPSYVFETARHLCLQRLRRRGRAGRALLRLAREPRQGEEGGVLRRLVHLEKVTALRRLLAGLSSDEQELLRLAFAEGLTSEEIGLRLGIEAGAARGRKHRLLRRLAASLDAGEDQRNSESEAGTRAQEELR